MTYQEFEPAIARLRTVYGDKAYPKERVEVIFRSVKYSSSRVWDETVTELIGEAMHAPPLSKIREVLYLVKKRFNESSDPWQAQREEIRGLERTSSCRQCYGSGTLAAHRRSDPHEHLFVFSCDCYAGQVAIQLPENRGKIRQWDMGVAQEWKHGFEIIAPSGSRQAARTVTSSAISAADMNTALGEPKNKPRGYKDELWEAEL